MEKSDNPPKRSVISAIGRWFGEFFIDYTGLTVAQKVLASAGYFLIIVLMIATVLLDFLGNSLPRVLFLSGENIFQTSLLVMFVSSYSFAIGWAYFLTGATDGGKRVFIPVAIYFGLQLLFFAPRGDLMVLWICAIPGAVAGLIIAFILFGKKAFWRSQPLLEFIVWAIIFIILVSINWLLSSSYTAVAEGLYASFNVILLLIFPFLIFSGYSVVDVACKIARWIVGLAYRYIPIPLLDVLIGIYIFARPAVALIVMMFAQQTTLFGSTVIVDAMIINIPLIVALIVFVLLRRWTHRNAAIFLALSIISPIFSIGMQMAFNNVDILNPVGLVVEKTAGFISPALAFVILMVLNFFGAGTSIANKEGKVIPRSGRILLLMGMMLLVISTSIFYLNVRAPLTGELTGTIQTSVNASFALGVILIGLPYLIWAVLRKKEVLIGDKLAGEAASELPPRRVKWLLIGGLIGLLGFCGSFAVYAVVLQMTKK